ncbi:MAG: hypothetical protein EXR98_00340 [Gemmataceae bacterium]|nr:hypothetical protein [Gemmataceae bacterium]
MARSLTLFAMIRTTSLASAADWPQSMGPNCDDVWAETRILSKFPEGGLKLLRRKPINVGFAGSAVAGGKAYVMDYVRSAGDEKQARTKWNNLKGKERVLSRDAKRELFEAADPVVSLVLAFGVGVAFDNGVSVDRRVFERLAFGRPVLERTGLEVEI